MGTLTHVVNLNFIGLNITLINNTYPTHLSCVMCHLSSSTISKTIYVAPDIYMLKKFIFIMLIPSNPAPTLDILILGFNDMIINLQNIKQSFFF
jgi:hypothetical protein